MQDVRPDVYLGRRRRWRRRVRPQMVAVTGRAFCGSLQECATYYIDIQSIQTLNNVQRSTGSQLCHQPLQHRRGAGPNRWVSRNAGSYQVHDALHSSKGMCFSRCSTGSHLKETQIQPASYCRPRPPVDTRAERWASARSSAAARAPRSQSRPARCPGNTHRLLGSTALRAAPLARHACLRSPRRSLLRRSPATAPSPGRPHSPANPPTASRCCRQTSAIA